MSGFVLPPSLFDDDDDDEDGVARDGVDKYGDRDDDFAADAEAAADRHASGWIRSALRETAVQSLRRNLRASVVVSGTAEEDPTAQVGTEEAGDATEAAAGNENGKVVRLELSETAVADARALCAKVGTAWSRQLEKLGHRRLRSLLDRIVAEENDDLYCSSGESRRGEEDGSVSSSVIRTTTSSSATARAAASRNASTTSTTLPATGPSDRGSETNGSGKERPSPNRSGECVTVLGRLRALGDGSRDRILAQQPQPPVTPGDVIRQLDDMAHRGLLDAYPYSWSDVEEKAAEIPIRLHPTSHALPSVTRHHAQEEQTTPEMKWIPKTLWEKRNKKDAEEDGEEEEEGADGPSEAAGSGSAPRPPQERRQQYQHDDEATRSYLIERKRKYRRLLPPPLPKSKRSKRQRVDGTSSRPANSDAPVQTWSWSHDVVGALSAEEREKLDRYVIKGLDEEQQQDKDRDKGAAAASAAPPRPEAVLLGPLCDTGGFHAWYQSQFDRARRGPKKNSKYARTHRRNRLLRERLGGQKEVKKEIRESRRVSRMVETIGDTDDDQDGIEDYGDDDQTEGRHWLHLDLGPCLLEVIMQRGSVPAAAAATGDGNTPKEEKEERKLYFFDSLEAMLLDEDASPAPA